MKTPPLYTKLSTLLFKEIETLSEQKKILEKQLSVIDKQLKSYQDTFAYANQKPQKQKIKQYDTSTRKYLVEVLKTNANEWLTTADIAHKVAVLGGRTAEGSLQPYGSRIASMLSAFSKQKMVEQKSNNRVIFWRLASFISTEI
ncbi:hypothetical protein A6B43_06410 [Vespertiliibacter pulmonis]|uniref:Uncharacterized protein n=1 Tax=Vespertiliibacter pulmonis TaxID=1443036 RepID=A0A3N4VQV8_9PAST|nr:DUF5320 domain-containing protein [Vespertiliibacter pulmonis]QLB21176.1 hypothetical protein A6B43_06410 [Vespertiliibacter pulmonis]RPE83715.1 hypothetical protein EDC46_0916 [Vespertiliibacter pulmonis]